MYCIRAEPSNAVCDGVCTKKTSINLNLNQIRLILTCLLPGLLLGQHSLEASPSQASYLIYLNEILTCSFLASSWASTDLTLSISGVHQANARSALSAASSLAPCFVRPVPTKWLPCTCTRISNTFVYICPVSDTSSYFRPMMWSFSAITAFFGSKITSDFIGVYMQYKYGGLGRAIAYILHYNMNIQNN